MKPLSAESHQQHQNKDLISRNSETESLHWASIEKNEEIEFLGLSQITWIMTMLVTLSMKGESRFLDPT